MNYQHLGYLVWMEYQYQVWLKGGRNDGTFSRCIFNNYIAQLVEGEKK